MSFRIEKDSLGEFQVPDDKLYGAQTARAVDNFPVSFAGIGREMVRALGTIKHAAATVNEGLGNLDAERAGIIRQAAQEVIDGALDEHFPVDVFQTGSGTSSNMNANEVISNRCIHLMGGDGRHEGAGAPQRPRQLRAKSATTSSPLRSTSPPRVASRRTSCRRSRDCTRHAVGEGLRDSTTLVKIGRTHLQDATPIRLGQEFSGYAAQVGNSILPTSRRPRNICASWPQGGTAVGTGINTHPEFGARMAAEHRATHGRAASPRPRSKHFAAQAMPAMPPASSRARSSRARRTS